VNQKWFLAGMNFFKVKTLIFEQGLRICSFIGGGLKVFKV
jgi:hypothetical protein